MIYNCDALDFLDHCPRVDCVFMDPPDNIGLDYSIYKDKRPLEDYHNWLELLIMKSMRLSPVVWLSYYWQHDIEVKYRVRNIIKYRHPTYEAKTFIWRYTFGQHLDTDCGSGFRYILRLARRGVSFNTDEIRIESERQRLGDKRANPDGRVPDDVWDLPRVTGNSAERRPWHPTQHPEALLERILRLSNAKSCADPFAGTGTTLRVAKRLGLDCHTSDLDLGYCIHISQENDEPLAKGPPCSSS